MNVWDNPKHGGGVLHNFDTAYSVPGIASSTAPGRFTFLDQMVVGVAANGTGDNGHKVQYIALCLSLNWCRCMHIPRQQGVTQSRRNLRRIQGYGPTVLLDLQTTFINRVCDLVATLRPRPIIVVGNQAHSVTNILIWNFSRALVAIMLWSIGVVLIPIRSR